MPPKDILLPNGLDPNKILFLVERDIPMLQKDVEGIRGDVEQIKDKQTEQSAAIQRLEIANNHSSTVIDAIKAESAAMNQKLDSFTQEQMKRDLIPWYKDFEKILILLLVLALMSVAGITWQEKLAEKALDKVVPTLIPSGD